VKGKVKAPNPSEEIDKLMTTQERLLRVRFHEIEILVDDADICGKVA
jgi:hypothetical protein